MDATATAPVPPADQKPNNAMVRDEFSESVIWDDMPSPLKRIAQSVYHAAACKYIYLGILACNVALGIWIIIESINESFPHPVFYVFECLINVTLLTDVGMRLWLNGCYRFWHSISNVFELALVSICFLLTIITIARMLFLSEQPPNNNRSR